MWRNYVHSPRAEAKNRQRAEHLMAMRAQNAQEPKLGDELSCVSGYPDNSDVRLTVVLGHEDDDAEYIRVCRMPGQGGDSFGAVAKMNSGGLRFINLNNIEQAEFKTSKSKWYPRFSNRIPANKQWTQVEPGEVDDGTGMTAAEQEAWQRDGERVVFSVVVAITLALGTIVLGVLTDWTFKIDIPAPEWFTRYYADAIQNMTTFPSP